MLNQEPGKLRIKCIKDAIDTKKRQLRQQQEALDQVMSEGERRASGAGAGQAQGGGVGVHPLERPEIPASIKAALFMMQLQQTEGAEKRVGLGSHVHCGGEVLSAEDVGEAQRLREEQFRQHQLRLELMAAQR